MIDGWVQFVATWVPRIDEIAIGDRPVRLDEVSEYWGQSSLLFPLHWLLVAVGGATAVMSLAAWLHRRQKRREAPPAGQLWRELASHAGLSLRDRWLVGRVVKRRGLPSGLTLLVCPATFDHHTTGFAAELPESRREALHDRFVVLRSRLFRG